jgi:hypothetical protein
MRGRTYCRIIFMLIVGVVLSSCSISTPFKFIEGRAPLEADREVLVVFTHVVLGEDDSLNELFWRYTFQIEQSLSQARGVVGHSVRKKIFAEEAWTMSAWEDEQSMNEFVRSGLHAEAAVKAGGAISRVEYARMRVRISQLPLSWSVAESALSAQNKSSEIAYGN